MIFVPIESPEIHQGFQSVQKSSKVDIYIKSYGEF